jgi:hypothetical protein
MSKLVPGYTLAVAARLLPDWRLASALPFQKPDHRSHRVLGGNRDTHVYMVRHQVPLQNLALFLPGQSVEDFSQVPTRLAKQHLAPSLLSHTYR